MSNYNRIKFKERARIEASIYAKESFSSIAKELGRNTSSITREVKQNRARIKGSYPHGKDCIYPPHYTKTKLCGDVYCSRRCGTCSEYVCTELCDRCRNHSCKKTEKAPFVCVHCGEKNKKSCRFDKYYYIAEKAAAKAKATRSESRKEIRLSQEEPLRTTRNIWKNIRKHL